MKAIFMGAVYAFLIVVMLLGPERMNHHIIMTDMQEPEQFSKKELETEREHQENEKSKAGENMS